MDVTASFEADVDPSLLFEVVSDLGRYPDWLDIVPRAAPIDGSDPAAWSVDLRGQIGPLRRSKRLRMVRTRHDEPSAARFERREVDGRSHSPWVMDATIEQSSNRPTRLVMRLHYGGSLWVPVLDRLLADEIERSRPRLLELLAAGS